jgi:glycosyltransferase involved in cell wall biosynthesis
MKVSGFSIIRDGVRFGYPFVESIRSVLPLVDEFVLAVGKSSDETLQRARAIDSPKLRIVETVWDEQLRRGGQVMAQQTNLALDECTGDWCFYIQADEVIHEADHARIRAAMQRHLNNRQIEGLSFRYRHFYGSYRLINPLPYRRQIRIVRGGIGVRSVGDACGFARNDRKLRSKRTGAQMYHYGWVREPAVMGQKLANFLGFYWDTLRNHEAEQAPPDVDAAETYQYETNVCVPFRGSHPAVMGPVIAAQDWPEPPFRYVPWWRNLHWWDGFCQKNFATLYRRLPRGKNATSGKAHRSETKRAA